MSMPIYERQANQTKATVVYFSHRCLYDITSRKMLKFSSELTYPLNPRRLLIGDAVFAAEFSPDIVKSEMR